jgi:SWI/SNF-related matrix-associated actin-dependent regulator 1 of chromatin subfamily A
LLGGNKVARYHLKEDKAYLDLYPFQKEAVKFLLTQGSGFLWDSPGLGKTRQSIVTARHICHYIERASKEEKGAREGHVLIVCPNALKRWWKKEIRKLYPNEQVLVAGVGGRFKYDAKGRRLEFEMEIPSLAKRGLLPRWTVVHYAGTRVAEDYYKQIPWDVVIIDECHYIKNRNARRTKAVLAITPTFAHRIGLTATPFGTNVADLWSQLRWSAPHVRGLASYWRFFGLFVEFEMDTNNRTGHRYRKILGGKNLELLAEVMAHYGLQRSKKVVAPQLPPITNTYIPLTLEGRQAHVHEALQKGAVEVLIKDTGGKVDEEGDAVITGIVRKGALARLIKMERWLSHPWDFDSGVKGAKLEWLENWMQSNTEPAVIATRFKSTAKHLAKLLGTRAITGDIPQTFRDDIVDDWQKGKKKKDGTEQLYLVGTIHTVGTGLNLERAWTMICFDQVRSPILMEQLRHRIHRITSDHPVEVVHLYVEGTTNELIILSYLRKWRDMEFVKHFMTYLRTGKMPELTINGFTSKAHS